LTSLVIVTPSKALHVVSRLWQWKDENILGRHQATFPQELTHMMAARSVTAMALVAPRSPGAAVAGAMSPVC